MHNRQRHLGGVLWLKHGYFVLLALVRIARVKRFGRNRSCPFSELERRRRYRNKSNDARLLCFVLLFAARGYSAGDPKLWSDSLREGEALCGAGDYAAAARSFQRALAIADRSLIDQSKLVEIHDALASAYAEAGQYSESEAEYRRALALVEKAEGQASLNYAVEVAGMAVLPTQSGDREPVIRVLRNALASYAQSGSVDNLTILRGCLALILRNQKRYEEAEPLLLKAVADLERQRAPDPHLLAGFLNDLAVLRLDQGRHNESLALQGRSIGVLEAALGKEHPSLIVPLNNLATTYVTVGRLNDASLIYQRAIDICGKTLGEDHLTYAVLLENYAVALKKLGQNRQARKIESKGLQIQRAANRRNGVGLTISLTDFRSQPALR